MIHRTLPLVAVLAAFCSAALPLEANANPIVTQAATVSATADIFLAGGANASAGVITGAIFGAGAAPSGISLNSGAGYLTFTNVKGSIPQGNGLPTCTYTQGCISINYRGNINQGNGNNPDGQGYNGVPSYGLGVAGGPISGIDGPGAGYLVGLFVGAGGPGNGAAPATLDFTTQTGTGNSFTSLSPKLDQTFYIGDGLTGVGTGSTQTFNVPTGAATL
ncbi:MAG: hypothetical protein KGK10_01045 [Rhodospirillales bacterium]|nr:hypothetical protein [Rhodospirillales bacterium]